MTYVKMYDPETCHWEVMGGVFLNAADAKNYFTALQTARPDRHVVLLLDEDLEPLTTAEVNELL